MLAKTCCSKFILLIFYCVYVPCASTPVPAPDTPAPVPSPSTIPYIQPQPQPSPSIQPHPAPAPTPEPIGPAPSPQEEEEEDETEQEEEEEEEDEVIAKNTKNVTPLGKTNAAGDISVRQSKAPLLQTLSWEKSASFDADTPATQVASTLSVAINIDQSNSCTSTYSNSENVWTLTCLESNGILEMGYDGQYQAFDGAELNGLCLSCANADAYEDGGDPEGEGANDDEETPPGDDGGLDWWIYLIIGIGALLVVIIIIYFCYKNQTTKRQYNDARDNALSRSSLEDNRRIEMDKVRNDSSDSGSDEPVTSDGKKLPPGWKMYRTDDGYPYYYNADSDETTWTLPSV